MVDAPDQRGNFFKVPRRTLHDQRVGANILHSFDSHGEAALVLVETVQEPERLGRSRVSQCKHPELGAWIDGLVQFVCQVKHSGHHRRRGHDDDCIRLDNGRNRWANFLRLTAKRLECAVQQVGQGFGIHMRQEPQVYLRRSADAKLLDFANEAGHHIHVILIAADDQHSKIFDRFDRDVPAQFLNHFLKIAPDGHTVAELLWGVRRSLPRVRRLPAAFVLLDVLLGCQHTQRCAKVLSDSAHVADTRYQTCGVSGPRTRLLERPDQARHCIDRVGGRLDYQLVAPLVRCDTESNSRSQTRTSGIARR